MSKKIDEVRELFIDPRRPETSEDLAKLGADAIRIMAQIYASGGDQNKADKRTQNWFKRPKVSGTLDKTMGELLDREFLTRRFDHKFMGQVHPQGGKIGILANLVAAYVNTNTIVKETSISEHRMELEAVDWLGQMFGYKKNDFSGNIVTDGTMANLTALWVARERKNKQLKQNNQWQPGIKMHVLVNDMRHYSIDKACLILGSPNVNLTILPRKGLKTDTVGTEKVIEQILAKGDEVLALVGLAGETETGEVDKINELADLADRRGIFLHIDAAYGGPFIMSKKGGLFAGINRADSITVDPHKMLYVPYQAGAVLFKDRKDHALIQMNARYLQSDKNTGLLGDVEERNFGFAARIEGSLGSGGVIATWATQKLIEKDGFGVLLDHTLDLTQYCYSRVYKSKVLRPLHVPELNTLLIGLSDNFSLDKKKHNKFIHQVQQSVYNKYGYYVSCNDDVDNNRSAFRFVAMHPWTGKEEVKTLIELIEKEICKRIIKYN